MNGPAFDRQTAEGGRSPRPGRPLMATYRATWEL